MRFGSVLWAVYAKEMKDALRDRRTMLVVLISGVLLGPLMLIALSQLVASLEARADQREVYVAGLERAPGLKNFFERQTWSVRPAPADFEAQLRSSKFSDPVVVVPEDFEAALQHGEQPMLEVVSDSSNKQSNAGVARVLRLLAGYGREHATLSLALRGVSMDLLEPLQIEERDLASSQARVLQLTSMLPFFVLMAVLYGALNAALDSTAGERERGSLEPLMMNPASALSLAAGKWAAVSSIAMLIAVLSSLSFLPAQWLLRSDTLQAMFRYGLEEAVLFMLCLLPFAAAFSAVLMAVAIRSRSFKEAQASASILLLLISLLPMFTLFSQSGESSWQLWVPAMAQNVLMNRVLKGEALDAIHLLVPLAVCVLLWALGLWLVARALRSAAVR